MRRAFIKMDEEQGMLWLQEHLGKCYRPLLTEPWILDVDTTIKILYGKQEGAEKGYNPQKPGRPSHTYHTYSMANLRLVLDVEVQPGNCMSASYTAPCLWEFLDKLPETNKPKFIRGDCAFGTDGVMSAAEARNLSYLFKLRMTKNVKKLAESLALGGNWTDAGQGWEGQESKLALFGWTRQRRVVVLRRATRKRAKVTPNKKKEQKQLELSFSDLAERDQNEYEYGVLITNMLDEIVSLAQHYRDRADSENIFDELKNQWGWAGFTTKDLKRCHLMAKIIALIYNWWNIFTRLAEPDKHLEAITSRPLLLAAVAKQTSHAGQKTVSISSTHGKIKMVQKLLSRIVVFFNDLKALAEQLTSDEMWYRILSKAVEKFLGGRPLKTPISLLNSS